MCFPEDDMAELYPRPAGGIALLGGSLGVYAIRRIVTIAVGPFSVASISPNSGRSAGDEPATVTGVFPNAITSVTFDGTPATSVVRVNATTITLQTPAGVKFQVAVVTVTDSAANTGNVPGGFTYN
jgi:large repetitive protein